jgi:hypothetical protein
MGPPGLGNRIITRSVPGAEAMTTDDIVSRISGAV